MIFLSQSSTPIFKTYAFFKTLFFKINIIISNKIQHFQVVKMIPLNTCCKLVNLPAEMFPVLMYVMHPSKLHGY